LQVSANFSFLLHLRTYVRCTVGRDVFMSDDGLR